MVTVGGELYVYEAPGLRAALCQAIEEDAGDLILSTLEVTLFDSTCLGALVGAVTQLRQRPGRRVLRVVDSGRVAKILRLTGLTEVLDLYPTVDDALLAVPNSQDTQNSHAPTPVCPGRYPMGGPGSGAAYPR
ncbi:STAS domain-containing protein [Streptomyces chryseus]